MNLTFQDSNKSFALLQRTASTVVIPPTFTADFQSLR